MSGGSLDYLYLKVEDAAERITDDSRPEWRMFAEHLKKVAAALHAIEWVLSSDYGTDGADKPIAEVFTDLKPRALSQVLQSLREQARQLDTLLGFRLNEEWTPWIGSDVTIRKGDEVRIQVDEHGRARFSVRPRE